ncbi:Ribonuclease BN [Imhoffiella purpurea]|uniref:Ribonuclease BN n=1 Tax=Imhoffiella purpurea TaxID=1249627 RepID=W9V3A1_9GAMM|nr:Ribonuclease BN [Imhoffiella purpurea]
MSLRTFRQISDQNVSMIAASIAFYGLLALFPAIAATIAIGGSVIDPQRLESQMASIGDLLPPEAASIILGQAEQVAAQAGRGLAFAATIGLLITLYSASRGMKSLIQGLNVVYGEKEGRGFIWLNLLAFLMTLGLIVGMVLALSLIAVVPAVIAALGLGGLLDWAVSLARWPILFGAAMLGLGIIYRYGPSRRSARWQWVTWGSVLGTLLWVVGSIAFSAYVQNFGSYNETYGSLGAVVILLLWFWLSAFIVLLGGALNAELEHQTGRDSTLGEPRPMGRRGAHVADTLGETAGDTGDDADKAA